eukprot:gene6993-8339_t
MLERGEGCRASTVESLSLDGGDRASINLCGCGLKDVDVMEAREIWERQILDVKEEAGGVKVDVWSMEDSKQKLKEIWSQLQQKEDQLQTSQKKAEVTRIDAASRMQRVADLERELTGQQKPIGKGSVFNSLPLMASPPPGAKDDGLQSQVDNLRGALMDAHKRLSLVADTARCYNQQLGAKS